MWLHVFHASCVSDFRSNNLKRKESIAYVVNVWWITWYCEENHFISPHQSRSFFFLFVLWQFVLLAVFSVWPASAHSSLCDFSFIPLLASAQRPEEVIQRYMEVVAGAPDEVNVSCFFSPLSDVTDEPLKKTYMWLFVQAHLSQLVSWRWLRCMSWRVTFQHSITMDWWIVAGCVLAFNRGGGIKHISGFIW